MKNNIKFVIIQAGGEGTRFNHFTNNKPKCLVSIKGKPILFHTFEAFKNAKFIIIVDYKRKILEKYLRIFAPTVDYQIVSTENKGTCAGIDNALISIPKNEPFIVTWSDLLFFQNPLSKINGDSNLVGLSKSFTCRWRFYNGEFCKVRSKKYGVAGFFIFKNKSELINLSNNGEFVQYLKANKINFKPLEIANTIEVGTMDKYIKIQKNYPSVRPFNRIKILKKTIIKIPLNEQGKYLSKLEKNFYKKLSPLNYKFIPKILKNYPLTLERINGKSLFLFNKLTNINKTSILKKIIFSLNKIHKSFPPVLSTKSNDYNAIIDKTYIRLSKIQELIPNIDSDYFIINNKKCINVFKIKSVVEENMNHFYPTSYFPIHGDLTFSNTLYNQNKNKVYFIDPRGYYGKIKIFGDIDYDWAKLYYSLIGNYDQFNIKEFILKIEKENIVLDIKSNNWEFLENLFFDLTNTDKNKIRFFHAIIWLSLTTYAWDNVDSILGAFYNGCYWFQNYYDKKTF